MARTFVAASSQSLTKGSAPVTAVPLTMACWFKPASIPAANMTPMCLDNGSTTDSFFLRVVATTGVLSAFTGASSVFAASTSAGALTAGTAFHIAGVYSAINSRIAYLNGVAATTDTTSLTPAGINATRIGSIAGIQFADGVIAEAGLWNVALTAAELTALAAAVSPLLVRPTSLIAYWPIYGQNSPETDVMVGATNLTVNNAPAQAAHPRIYTACNGQKC